MALRLRYEIDTPRRLQEHVHLVDGIGYFFFPGAVAPKGTLASLEVTFTTTDQTAVLRGWVWARPSHGGIWLELGGAGRCLRALSRELERRTDPRLGTEQLVLLEAEDLPALLCRLRDVSAGGARLAALPADAGTAGMGARVALPEADAVGSQLEAVGRVAWAGEGEVGIEWDRGDLASRAAIERMLHLAGEEWHGARSATHPRSCRCVKGGIAPEVLLLG
jgi:hypothetical protein